MIKPTLWMQSPWVLLDRYIIASNIWLAANSNKITEKKSSCGCRKTLMLQCQSSDTLFFRQPHLWLDLSFEPLEITRTSAHMRHIVWKWSWELFVFRILCSVCPMVDTLFWFFPLFTLIWSEQPWSMVKSFNGWAQKFMREHLWTLLKELFCFHQS